MQNHIITEVSARLLLKFLQLKQSQTKIWEQGLARGRQGTEPGSPAASRATGLGAGGTFLGGLHRAVPARERALSGTLKSVELRVQSSFGIVIVVSPV